MSSTLEYAGFLRASTADGPGIRSVFFFHGCRRNCPGCHNSGISVHGSGKSITVDEAVKLIESGCRNHRITISGGEPLEQSEQLKELLYELKHRDYNICLYTGGNLDEVPADILSLPDYVKAGSFVAALKDGANPYAGSSNQHMYTVVNGNISEMVA